MVYINGEYVEIHHIWENEKTKSIFDDEGGGEWRKPNNEFFVNSYDEKTKRIIKKNEPN